MNIAILDDNLAVIACDTELEAYHMRASLEDAAARLAPWRFLVVGRGAQFADLRSDPALAEDVDRLRSRIGHALAEAERARASQEA